MRKTQIVAWNTYLAQLKSKSFLSILLIPWIIFIIAIVFAGYLIQNTSSNNDNSSDYDNQIAIIAPQNLQSALKKADANDFTFKFHSPKQAKKQFNKGNLDGYVTIETHRNQYQVHYFSDDTLDSDVQNKIMQIVNQVQIQDNARRGNLTTQQKQSMAIQPVFKNRVITHPDETNNDNSSDNKQIAIHTIIWIIYFFLIIYASIMANIAAREKQSKVSEIIFSSITSRQYFLGKVGGVCLLILTQFVLYSVTIMVTYQFFVRNHWYNQSILTTVNGVLNNLFNINLAFILVALATCIILAALCGALSSSSTDASKSASPLIILVVVILGLASGLTQTDNNLIVQILSYIPFLSSFIMPIQLINGHATWLNGIIALLLSIGTLMGLTYLISGAYQRLMLTDSDGNLFRRLAHGWRNH
jgi:ABC-2 type transport system permease protein